MHDAQALVAQKYPESHPSDGQTKVVPETTALLATHPAAPVVQELPPVTEVRK
jgi:hypothetical protein